MAECVEIIQERIRSKITIEGLSWGVPGTTAAKDGYLKAFSISQSRGDPVAKLSCTLETWVTSNYSEVATIDDQDLGACIRVWAGIDSGNNSLPQLFTGYIRDLRVLPHFSDARLVILEITAEDVFSKMRDHKYSRRFKMKDGAFAIITGGVRRQGGRMNQLRNNKASTSHRQNKDPDSYFGENSPLITTPSPTGTKPWNQSKQGTESDGSVYHFEPQHLIMKPGDRAVVSLYNQKGELRKVGAGSGMNVNINSYKPTCLCFVSPNFSNTTNQGGSAMTKSGFKACDITKGDTTPGSIRIITDSDTEFANFIGSFLVEMRDWYPFQILYIDPETKGTSKIDVSVIYPHSHEDLSTGGPAKGVYDTFLI